MRVERVINNNVISAIDVDGCEVVVMGKGIGFGMKPGREIQTDAVEKIFKMDNQGSVDRLAELMKKMPIEHILVADEIIDYAKNTLGKRMNPNIYITLTDHVNFTLERYKKGMMFDNPLLWEVKHFYPSEYLIGEYAIALIERKLGIRLEVDEAASVALHIVNAEYNAAMNETMNITRLIKEVLGIVKEYLQTDLDEESLYYSRFITHLKFLSQRIFTKERNGSQEAKLAEMIISLYPEEYKCGRKIGDYIKEHYGHIIPEEELSYLTLHIKRIKTSTEQAE